MKSRLNLKWTPADERKLRDIAKSGLSAKVAAVCLRRSRGAVAYKAMCLGVRFTFVEQPRGVQRRPATRRRARASRLAYLRRSRRG